MSVFKKIKDVLFDIEDDEDTSVSRETTTKVVKENNPIKEVKMPVEYNHDDEISSEMPKKNNSFNKRYTGSNNIDLRAEERELDRDIKVDQYAYQMYRDEIGDDYKARRDKVNDINNDRNYNNIFKCEYSINHFLCFPLLSNISRRSMRMVPATQKTI